MMERKRITGYVTPSLNDCYNEHAKQVVEDCAERYAIVPNLVHKEKGIETFCKNLDRLLKEVYKDYKLLDKYYHKKFRILDISDRITYSTDYPLCEYLSEVDVRGRYIKHTGVMESRIISPEYTSFEAIDFNAVVCASRITTNMRKIAALLLWLRKYGTIDDWYVPKNNKAVAMISNLHTAGMDTLLTSTCDITVNFYKGGKFDKRVSYSKKGKVRECLIIGDLQFFSNKR